MSNRMRAAIVLVLAAGLVVAACDGGDDSLPTDGEWSTYPGLPPLKRATYLTESLPAGQATLEDGQFRAPAAPGSAAEIVIQLGEWANGDLDGESAGSAAITIEQTGGSGTFYFIHALLTDPGGENAGDDAVVLRDVGAVLLGDRIRIVGVAIANREIVVALLDRPPGASFAEEPTVAVTRRFALEGGALAEVGGAGNGGSTAGEAFACDTSLPAAAIMIVRSPQSGESVASGFEVSGCSRAFEGGVSWRLLDRAGETLARGATIGGGVDGPRPYAFTVECSTTERQLGHLEVFEEDISDGQGFPPSRDVVPLVLEPDS
ncbi:MAG: Gmad2 immunoglobulin-like domain-containing protein [Chloroflexi bacterium]|nr:Gmad2 immunoglobulin-like domain-containing protein [Chloroflexota bacterium]